ncbi:MAG: hypothetical protein H6Q74_604 [Firmicutes bacterium]|nr:hypothetical protein [Bacillota bacterium]
MINYFADFHIHVGISEAGQWIKIPTSRRLTLRNILYEAAEHKGMEIVGIVDCMSPLVMHDLKKLLAEGLVRLDAAGGYRYNNKLTLILGTEIETTEPGGGRAHTLVFLPDISQMESFKIIMQQYIRNINLSTQNAHMSLAKFINIAAAFDSLIVPAHVFTPFKSIYGNCTDRLSRLLSSSEIEKIAAIELGLSADTSLADRIGELAEISFLSNSDAHSTEKIAREYNILAIKAPTFRECQYAFRRKLGRKIVANYGLDPRLGKYHRTACSKCGLVVEKKEPFVKCPKCGETKTVRGVLDRINLIADYDKPSHPEHRPVYHYQIPLDFVPGLGKVALTKLLAVFGTEMAILHQAPIAEIRAVVGEKLALAIDCVRKGRSKVMAGGGGLYGKLAIK